MLQRSSLKNNHNQGISVNISLLRSVVLPSPYNRSTRDLKSVSVEEGRITLDPRAAVLK